MKTPPYPNQPMPVKEAPDWIEPELAPLLSAPMVQAMQAGTREAAPAALRTRLMERVAASRQAQAINTTVRRARVAPHPIAGGVSVQTLYEADTKPASRPLRPGEPLRAVLVQLAPGSAVQTDLLAPPAHHREWLVLQGEVDFDGAALALRDYRVDPAGQPAPALRSSTGALLFLREAALPALTGDQAHMVRDGEAGWPEFAPGVQRRVLWQRAGQAALLYYAQPGAQVPHHTHGHDEECLMVQGELFLDDVLLQPGDYQLAPAGSDHRLTHTDTGVVLYAHGDLELQFVG